MEISAAPILRPLRLGELLDQAIRIYRRNFLTFLGIIALGYIPYAVLQIGSSVLSIFTLSNADTTSLNIFRSPSYWLSAFGSIISLAIYIIFVNGLCTAALTNSITRNYFGQKTGILQAYQQLGASWGKLIGTLVLFGIIYVGAMLWFIIPCVGWLSGAGLLAFLAGVVMQIIPAIVVIEKVSGTEAIARAWDLGRRRFWWLIGFAIVFYLFNALVVTGPAQLINYLATILLNKAGLFENAASISLLISTLVSNLINLLILPIQLTAWTLVYFDLRVRTEGFDLALATIVPSEDVLADISSIPPAPRAEKWLTGDEIGKFVIITLVVGGLYALLIGLIALTGFGLSSLGGL